MGGVCIRRGECISRDVCLHGPNSLWRAGVRGREERRAGLLEFTYRALVGLGAATGR